MEEVISPEEYFDNNVIKDYIERALSSKSRLFAKYNHYEIYNVNAKERNDLDTRFLHYLYARSFDENKCTV